MEGSEQGREIMENLSTFLTKLANDRAVEKDIPLSLNNKIEHILYLENEHKIKKLLEKDCLLLDVQEGEELKEEDSLYKLISFRMKIPQSMDQAKIDKLFKRIRKMISPCSVELPDETGYMQR